MLRKIRMWVAIASLLLVTLLFLDFTGTVHQYFGWLAKIQFWPALLALNFVVVGALVLLTLLLGRVYCSVICPLGIFQDVVSRIAGMRKKNRFGYSAPMRWLRYGVLVLFAVAFFAGISSFVALLSPYSAYGRIAGTLFAPLYQWANNLLAYLAERAGSYAFYSVDVWFKGVSTFVVAVATLAVISVLAWRSGRTYCNTICPVGTVLGFMSRFSLLRIRIDTSNCNSCGLCARNCKASCINPKEHEVDYGRCVACMDCIDKCKKNAISYSLRFAKSAAEDKKEAEPAIDESRRKFLTVSALLATTAVAKAQSENFDGGLAVIEEKKVPKRNVKLKPAGARSIVSFERHCTACQLCVSECPNQVLRPSSDLSSLMQPEMSYERGYCRPECTRCSDICPTGAIQKIEKADKAAIQIGHAVWIKENCIVNVDGVKCGNCARHCPAGAIWMMPVDPNNPDSPEIPVLDSERCIGCGACENLCPARPFSAIYVEGNEVHRNV